MSISPPSDIVLDVARAADPARYSQAAAKLTRTAPAADDFADFLSTSAVEGGQAAKPTAADTGDVPDKAATINGSVPTHARGAKDAFQGFEAMTLASLIEQAMPDDAVYYGDGVAGGVWKSMLAEQIGKQMAKAGGIGLARQLASSAIGAVAGGEPAGATAPGEAARSLLVHRAERGFLSTLDQSTSEDSETTL